MSHRRSIRRYRYVFRMVASCLAVVISAFAVTPASAQQSDTEVQLQLKVLERKLGVARAEFEQARHRAAAATDEESKTEARDLYNLAEAKYALARAEVEAARQRFKAEAAERQSRAKAAAKTQEASAQTTTGEDTRFVVFRLKYVSPGRAAVTLSKVLGNATLRLAVDDRTKSLVLAGSQSQLEIVRTLLEELDRPAAESADAEKPKPGAETLQLRVIWVVDDQESELAPELKPAEGRLESHVIRSLADLGIEAPKVVCQPITSLVLCDDGRSGEFDMDVPVLLADTSMRLRAEGHLVRFGDDHYMVEFQLGVAQPAMMRNPDGTLLQVITPRGQSPVDSIKGSIVTPLDHYTVLGTSVVVPGGQRAKRQLPCAFVVHLDRARTFPAEAPRKVEF